MNNRTEFEVRGSTIVRSCLTVVAAGLLLLGAACEDEPAGETTPMNTVTPALATDLPATLAGEATATSTGASGIRGVDFSSVAELRDFITENGGEIDPAATIFADLTGDGNEDAVVPVSSGGTLGNLAIFVFSFDSYGTSVLLQAQPEGGRGITADLQEGQLFIDEASYRANDPECCPSLITRRYYRWDGGALVVDREEQITSEPGVR